VTFVFVTFVALVTFVYAQPDPRQMSGLPLPVADLAVGTVTARVIKGQLTNPLAGQTVELTGAGAAKTATTDASGRATFTGLTPGTRVKVQVSVGGERIESQEFQVPAAGGIRLMLVATDATAVKSAPAVAGSVAFGQDSRFVIELGDDALNVFNILQIVNPGQTPVKTAPLVFDLPKGAVGVGLLEGSPSTAVAAGSRVTVNGPFPPGNTLLQFAYSIPLGRESIAIEQKLPASLPQLSVIAQKIGAMQVVSPQLSQRREMAADGNTYIVGQGGALNAGDTVSLTLTGLPSRPSWPSAAAVAIAAGMLAWGGWAASRRGRTVTASRRDLHGRRDKLFAELTSLEAQRRKGTLDAAAYAARRESLVTALEDLYRGLDREVA
jgi:hypothetical protein